jgi:hypothetical protein
MERRWWGKDTQALAAETITDDVHLGAKLPGRCVVLAPSLVTVIRPGFEPFICTFDSQRQAVSHRLSGHSLQLNLHQSLSPRTLNRESASIHRH